MVHGAALALNLTVVGRNLVGIFKFLWENDEFDEE